MQMQRNRLVYAAIIAVVIAAGLLSRSRFATHLPPFLATYAGDTLWALAVYTTLCFIFPRMKTLVVVLITIAISFSVEFSQLYQAQWINTIRATRIGALFLGAGFKGSDLPCYTVGSLLGVAVDVLVSLANRNRDINKPLERTS